MALSERYFSRVGAVAAVLGILIYGGSAVLHPWTPPHETEAAFADYAAEPHWAYIHLAELLGILLMSAAALALAWRLRRGAAGVWAALGAVAMVLCAGVYAVFAAVDGVALGILVDRWADAGPERRELLFETAFAVRQVEAGLFSLQWWMFGIAAVLFAAAFFKRSASPIGIGWMSVLAWLSVLAGIGTLSFAAVQARTGFSELSMTFQTGLYAGVVWIVAVSVFLYRYPEFGDCRGERTATPQIDRVGGGRSTR